MPKIRISSDFWFRQRSTFPGSHPPSIINAEELNFRVRNGNGWILFAIATGFYLFWGTSFIYIPSKLNNAYTLTISYPSLSAFGQALGLLVPVS